MNNTVKKRSKRSVKVVLNNNFTFSDLSPRFKNVDSTTGNIFCPFHENHYTPAAKMYWNEQHQIWILHCFGQCHRNFTAYDYVELILCEKYQKYTSPLDFLLKNMDKTKLYNQLDLAEKEYQEELSVFINDRLDYVNKLSEEHEATEDYIEALYLG